MSFEWVERDCCWICDRWHYVLLIWSEALGDHLYDTRSAITVLQMHPSVSTDGLLDPLIYVKDHPPVKMMPMIEFMERLDKNTKPHTRTVVIAEEQERLTLIAESKK